MGAGMKYFDMACVFLVKLLAVLAVAVVLLFILAAIWDNPYIVLITLLVVMAFRGVVILTPGATRQEGGKLSR